MQSTQVQPVAGIPPDLQLNELIVELSYNCNISCEMCGFGQHPIDRNKFMSWKQFQSIIDGVGDRAKIVRLNGRGESTIHPQFSEMAAYVRQQLPEAQINLFSNLSFKSDRILQTMHGCLCEKVVRIPKVSKIGMLL